MAASVANPMLEYASNRGLFGPGNFTDHSNADIAPTLMCGALFAAFYLWTNVRARNVPVLSSAALRRLLPTIFVAQILALAAMETAEQLFMFGHPLGGLLWMGAPAPISLTVHALACVAVALAGRRVLQALAKLSLDLVIQICSMLRRGVRRPLPLVASLQEGTCGCISIFSRWKTGERSPPLPIA